MGGVIFSKRADHNAIAEQLHKQRAKEASVIKILILGAAECGKSTILKQMKVINGGGFLQAEIDRAKMLAIRNTLQTIQTLITAMDTLNIEFTSPESRQAADSMMKIDLNAVFLDDACHLKDRCAVLTSLQAVWADEAVKACSQRDSEIMLLDSAIYFLDKAADVLMEDYLPSNQDVLQARETTHCITETPFIVDKQRVNMVDVGGQRNYRRSWMTSFEDATAVMFVASLSEYNQVLEEDPSTNRLTESLIVFHAVCRLPWLKNVETIILFLNKHDIFKEKVLKHDIGGWHKEYTGGLDYDAGLNYIKSKFRERTKKKKLVVHCTTATSTSNIRIIWKAAKALIFTRTLDKTGL